MPGTITPLPIMLQEEEDRKAYQELNSPKSIVVRFGYLKQIAELAYNGSDKPGCGSKMVIRTKRGIELAEMLTTTCGNDGCSKSVSREKMLDYIQASGGKDYPFFNQGKVLRIANHDDLHEQRLLDDRKQQTIQFAKEAIRETKLPMTLVDVEPLLGGERLIFHYIADEWVDFRELVRKLATEYQTRIEMHQVNDRNEARLVADYEKCGQHCCCKQFLKVLKPVSMRSAKVQKATLDPAKISGRCGRLMCCLRYEDQTYQELLRNLPRRQTAVDTPAGRGVVLSTQILTQLVLVRLDDVPNKTEAYPVEDVSPASKKDPAKSEVPSKVKPRPQARTQSKSQPREQSQKASANASSTTQQAPKNTNADQNSAEAPTDGKKKKRRRRRRRRGGGGGNAGGGSGS